MLFSLAEKVAIFFISRHMIPLDDRDWAIYALQRYISAAFFYPILFFLGCLCCDAFTSLIFFAVFTGLRHRIGGHHAKTPLRCFAISICILIFGLGVYPTMTWLLPDTFDVVVCFSAGVFIWIIGLVKTLAFKWTCPNTELIENKVTFSSSLFGLVPQLFYIFSICGHMQKLLQQQPLLRQCCYWQEYIKLEELEMNKINNALEKRTELCLNLSK